MLVNLEICFSSLDILEAAACLGTMASAMGPTPGSPDGAMSNDDNYDRWRDEDGKGDDDDDDDDDDDGGDGDDDDDDDDDDGDDDDDDDDE